MQSEWTNYSRKYLRHPRNAEFVTGRVNIINNRNVISISIGKIVCELLNFKKKDRVKVYINKDDRHLLLIEKNNDFSSYSLLDSDQKKSNFLRFAFRYDFNEAFHLSQTIVLNYEINDEKMILIDLEKLKWRK